MTANFDWLNRLLAVECRDATYPVAPDEHPLVFDRALGSVIVDVAGRAYLDLCAGFGALALGHNPDCVKSVLQQFNTGDGSPAIMPPIMPPMIHGMGDVYPSRAKIQLIEGLQKLLPERMSRVSLAISGGQAVEVALKSAMIHTGAAGFICFREGYHGVDLGVLPVTSRSDFKEPFLKYLNTPIAAELPYGCDISVVGDAVEQLRNSSSGFAGIIVEPVQGRGGVVVPPSGWLSLLADVAHAHGGVLIFDEILTGLGRRGKWTEADSVDADLVCFGKALGGGMPLSACVGTEEIMNSWPQSTGEAIHTGTFFGHPLTCMIALSSLEEMQRVDVCRLAQDNGEWFYQQLKTALGNHSAVAEIRWGGGLMLAIHFADDVGPAPGAKMMDRLRRAGVIALASGAGGSSLSLTPALNITRADLTRAISILSKTIE